MPSSATTLDEKSDATEAVDDRPGSRRPPIPALVAFAFALVFASVATTYWWLERDPQPGAVDVGFYDDMTAHHEQAIAMSHTYMRYGEDELLWNMANEIDRFQSGDIRVMQDAMQAWGEVGTPDVAMEWMGMPAPQQQQPGMATDEQLEALETARGAELDDLFTRIMIDHHASGAEMAAAAADGAKLDEVREFAAIMASGQRAEIGELNFAREQLGLPEYQPPAFH